MSKQKSIPLKVLGEPEECGRGHACTFCPKEVSCKLDQPKHNQRLIEHRLKDINHVLLVLANKGGVGKSMVSANLVAALSQQGYQVGLADADIHGPNAPRLLGLQNERVRISEQGIKPPIHQLDNEKGFAVGSLAYFLSESDTPVVWRDAYKHDFIHHLIGSYDWGLLDYLIVDMPPGTGNELITLCDLLEGHSISALLVSTADAIVLQDTLKASRFCRERGLPVIGMAENFAGSQCPHCGGEFVLFPRAAEIDQFEKSGIDTLIRLPFSSEIAVAASNGCTVVGQADSKVGHLFIDLAVKVSSYFLEQSQDGLLDELKDVLSNESVVEPGPVKKILEEEQHRLGQWVRNNEVPGK